MKKYILGLILSIMSVMDAKAMMAPADPHWEKPNYIAKFSKSIINSRCSDQYYRVDPEKLSRMALPSMDPNLIGRYHPENNHIRNVYSRYDLCVACLERAEREMTRIIQQNFGQTKVDPNAQAALAKKIQDYRKICPRLMIG